MALDREKVYKDVLERIKNAHKVIEILEKIEPVLKLFHEKKITKRIETKIANTFPEYNVYYTTAYGMYHLHIKHEGTEVRLLLGYQGSSDIFDYNKYLGWNVCHSLDKERVVKYEKAVARLSDWCNRYDKIKDDVKNLQDDMKHYDLQYILDWKYL